MKIRIFVGVALLVFLAASCTAMMSSGEREKMYGKAVPVITESFASKELRPGDTWKVYLKASDPDGDMRYIVSVLSAGMGRLSCQPYQNPGRKQEGARRVYLSEHPGLGGI